MNIDPFPEELLPGTDAVVEPWWEGTRQKRLLVQRCSSCHTAQLYPRALCASCGAGADLLAFVEASGRGTVVSFTEIHRAPNPAFAVPYTVALVRLDEGPVILTRLVGTAQPVCDSAVELDWWPLGDGRHLPLFTSPPARATSGHPTA